MKRWLLLLGVVIIFILLGIWVFLLFASDETKETLYNQFGFAGTEEVGIIDTIVDIALPDLEEEVPPLRQLTTKRVAGYTEVALASSSPQIYFSEAGTGHLYTLDIQSGVETRIANITIAGAHEAAISKNGTFALIKAGNTPTGPLTVVTFTGSTTESFAIDEPVLNFTITQEDQILYSVTNGTEVLGRTFDVKNRSAQTIFRVPFRQATVLWSTSADTPHFVLPHAARTLEGFLYEVKDGRLHRSTPSGYGLAALPSAKYTLYTKASNSTYLGYMLNNQSNTVSELILPFFPEKCVIASSGPIYCGHDPKAQDSSFPDNWYRGELSFADSIWSINPETLEFISLIDTLSVSGRELDIIDVSLSIDEMSLYFVNKNDFTLWTYNLLSQTNN
jgi:hypothetical protein